MVKWTKRPIDWKQFRKRGKNCLVFTTFYTHTSARAHTHTHTQRTIIENIIGKILKSNWYYFYKPLRRIWCELS